MCPQQLRNAYGFITYFHLSPPNTLVVLQIFFKSLCQWGAYQTDTQANITIDATAMKNDSTKIFKQTLGKMQYFCHKLIYFQILYLCSN